MTAIQALAPPRSRPPLQPALPPPVRGPALAITASIERSLRHICNRFHKVHLASALTAEDMVLTDVIARLDLPVEIVALVAGPKQPDTYSLLARVEQHYSIRITAIDSEDQGLSSQAARFDADAWLTGIRRAPNETLAQFQFGEQGPTHRCHWFYPLLAWTEAQVWAYLSAHEVPLSEPRR